MTICRRVAWWVSKATRAQANARAHAPTPIHPSIHEHKHTHASSRRTHTHKYVILIGFPRQQWVREWASMLRCTLFIFIREKDVFTARYELNL